MTTITDTPTASTPPVASPVKKNYTRQGNRT